MKQFRATKLSSVYGEKTLLDTVSFLVETGDRIGIVGVNGAGKTTLLNAIAQTTPADSGLIETPNDYSIGYLTQEPQLDEDKLVMDAIFAGAQPIFALIRDYEAALETYSMDPNDAKSLRRYTQLEERMTQEDAWLAESEVKTILTQLHLPNLNLPVSALSGGQRKRVGLAQILIQAPDLLLLDEPTNHLDFDSIEWLEKYLTHYKGAVMAVTHDRYFLDHVANRVFELSFGQLYEYTGNYEAYVTAKAERVAAAKVADHKQAQLYKQELAWMRTSARARSTKQKARENRFAEVAEKQGTLKLDSDVEVNLGQTRLGKKVINIEQADLSFDQLVILEHFDTLIQANQRIGITGPNGTGKSSLLNVIAGKVALDAGTVEIGETVKLAYYTQQTEPIPDDKRVIAYLSEVAETVTNRDGDRVSVTELLEQFLFPSFMHGTLIRKLSGGEKRRLYLLKLLLEQPNVLLLDEPTNDLDIGTLTVLEDYLQKFAGTVITVSHDRYFLDKVADRLFIFHGQGQIETYDGQFSDYLLKNGAPMLSSGDHKPAAKQYVAEKEVTRHDNKGKKKLTYAEQIEYGSIEAEIEQLETDISDITANMNQSGTDFEELAVLQQTLDAKNELLETKMNRWAELEERSES
ncbi:ABC-F family ATP-binding cassette domain-containing protein [Weissella diestrammenae]|uniref:ABC-F family ATP-binding cassette domain-containing protein n=1 Tax=Weissella diestrammenae TaxID=1162633 RepID=A0A7G9T5R6_9LACO|nr:ABC-F family ATP-binding cassette domain-containing protein [Weissella diestrammenae]MCM0582269.1 ABC-F family ATP-binding cassette domain-containing protein [Weissella diestrammenae]QNN75441.1 ABC-F family ATP-binding cassette domain-containing protein [Weissella diestrammenae]